MLDPAVTCLYRRAATLLTAALAALYGCGLDYAFNQNSYPGWWPDLARWVGHHLLLTDMWSLLWGYVPESSDTQLAAHFLGSALGYLTFLVLGRLAWRAILTTVALARAYGSRSAGTR